jgi:hypothetical protein
MPKLRKLRFATFDDAIADIERLRSGPYERGGAWSLTQCCDHLANTIDVGLNGGLKPLMPWVLRATLVRFVFEGLLLTECMPSGAPAPPELHPAKLADEDPAKIDRCLRMIAAARDRTDPIPPSPFVVGMTLPKWKKLQRIHLAHHLAFLKSIGI